MSSEEDKMKKQIYLIFVLVLLVNALFVFPQQDEPIIVSPLIGGDLDRVERDYFHLFPQIDGFEKAVFYLNDDKSFRAKITTNINDEFKDTIIERYSSISDMENHITTRVFVDLRENAGPDFTVHTSFSRLAMQKMVTLNEQKLFTIDKLTIDQKFKEPSLSSIWETEVADINAVIKEGKSNVPSYIMTGTAIGGVAGFLVGWIAGKNDKKELIPSEFSGAIVGMLIGGAIGLITGAILGISSSEEEVMIDPLSPSGISTLKSYSLYYRHIEQKKE
jgi:hypothetical protein